MTLLRGTALVAAGVCFSLTFGCSEESAPLDGSSVADAVGSSSSSSAGGGGSTVGGGGAGGGGSACAGLACERVVVVTYAGEPLADLAVVVSAADGSVAMHTKTDAMGTAEVD